MTTFSSPPFSRIAFAFAMAAALPSPSGVQADDAVPPNSDSPPGPPPRVAVWDPVTLSSHNRVHLQTNELNRVAANCGGRLVEVSQEVRFHGGLEWVELRLAVPGRTVLRIDAPKNASPDSAPEIREFAPQGIQELTGTQVP